MLELFASVSIGVLTNTLYDLVKSAGYIFSKRFNERDLHEIVEQKVSASFPDELQPLFDSSTFIEFFNTPHFLDVVNAFIEHKIICDCTIENSKIQKYINKPGIINSNDIIKYISDSISELYKRKEVLMAPSDSVIMHAVSYIVGVAEEIVASNLTDESSEMLFFINTRADKNHQDIIAYLSQLQKSIEQIQKKQPAPTDADFELFREKYHSILRDKNSVAHIYLLDKFPFEKFYVPPILHRSTFEMSSILGYREYSGALTSWNDIFCQSNIVYLTGGAGYGKSLFAKKIINDFSSLKIFRSSEYLVIYGELKAFYPSGSDCAISVLDFLKASIRSSTLLDAPAGFVEHYLNSGRCIILLDALDEVEKAKRTPLHEGIISYFKSQNPNNKICLTSRNRGFIPERNVEVLNICPLTEDQIDKYVNKIISLGKFEKQDKEPFMKQTKVLVDKGFLNSFLVLSLLINIYKAELELPENKLELYQKCFEYIANKREKEKTQSEFNWKAISPIMKDNTFIELSRLGIPNNSDIDKETITDRLLQIYKTKYSSEVDAENAIEEFLKFCSDRTELFVPSAEDKFKFFHRSFFEYFYSLYIFYRCKDAPDILAELRNFDVDSEVFELTVAMLKQKSEEKYQELIELMFSEASNELSNKLGQYTTFNILVLTMQVVDDAVYKEKFLEIVLGQKNLILSNINEIHNLKLLSSIYENDYCACHKICDCFHEEGLLYIFDNFERLFLMLDRYEEEVKENFFKRIFESKGSVVFRRQFFHRYMDDDSYFFMPFFSKVWDYKKVLLETPSNILLELFKKHYRKNYRRKTLRTESYVKKFQSFSDEEQDKLIKYIYPATNIC